MGTILLRSFRALASNFWLGLALVMCFGVQAHALSLALTESDTSPKYGRVDVTLTATITPWTSGYNGTLYFYDNNLEFQAVAVATGTTGVYSITIPNVYAGAHTFMAHYIGSNGGNPSGSYSKTFTQNILATPPPGSVFAGAWVNKPSGYSDVPSNLGALESDIGRKVAVSLEYAGWDPTVNWVTSNVAFNNDLAAGRIPLMSWHCAASGTTVSQIQSSTNVAYIDTIVQSLINGPAANGQPVMLRWCWEMNLTYNQVYYAATTETGQQTEFINGWQYLMGRIRTDFANTTMNPNQYPMNITFVFNPGTYPADPQTSSYPSAPIGYLWYPGPTTVDWIGLDKYDNSPAGSGNDFENVVGISWINSSGDNLGFYPFFTNVTNGVPVCTTNCGYDKPLLIGETGAPYCGVVDSCVPTSGMSNPDNQLAYLDSVKNEIPTSFPYIRDFNYFSASGTAGDWELDGSSITGYGGIEGYYQMACSTAFLYSWTGTPYTCSH